jgi:hypothetical protein
MNIVIDRFYPNSMLQAVFFYSSLMEEFYRFKTSIGWLVCVMSGGRLVCRVCGRQLLESDAVPVYKKVLDRERG